MQSSLDSWRPLRRTAEAAIDFDVANITICTAGRCCFSPWTLFAAILLALFPVERGMCQKVPVPDPIIQLNVGALGYTPEPLPLENYGRLGIDPICYLSDDTVVITFITREAPVALSRRDKPDESLPYRLHALFVDTKTGKQFAERYWPVSSPRSRVIPTTGHNFVVLTPDLMLLYSPELSLLSQLDVPWGQEAVKDQWDVARSPGGKYVLVSYEPESDERRIAELPRDARHLEPVELRFEWIDLEDLHVVERWTRKECVDCFWTVGISDDGIVQRWNNVPGGTPFNSKIVEVGRPPDGPWRELCPYFQPYCRPGKFISNGSILATDQTKRLETIWVVSTRGELLFHDTFGENETLFSLHHTESEASADGRRFAVAVMKIKGANAIFDIGGHANLDRVKVFDIASRQWIYMLDARKRKIADISGMALSPDGSHLALITQGEILEIYRVP